VEILRRLYGGLGRSGDHRQRGIARAEQDTDGGPRLDSGAARLGVESGSLGKLRGGEAELLRVLAGAGVHRSGRPTSEQKRLRSELRCAAATRVLVVARVGCRGFRVQL
jgi:hypothetical protein